VLELTDVLRGRAYDTSLDALADLPELADLVTSGIEPEADIHASSGYRRHLAGVLTLRAVSLAAREAAA
jgi:carbon-monoxide dehydrogenase medium subunit